MLAETLTLSGTNRFVRHEWETVLATLIETSPNMEPGWRGILYANFGMIEGQGMCEDVPVPAESEVS